MSTLCLHHNWLRWARLFQLLRFFYIGLSWELNNRKEQILDLWRWYALIREAGCISYSWALLLSTVPICKSFWVSAELVLQSTSFSNPLEAINANTRCSLLLQCITKPFYIIAVILSYNFKEQQLRHQVNLNQLGSKSQIWVG